MTWEYKAPPTMTLLTLEDCERIQSALNAAEFISMAPPRDVAPALWAPILALRGSGAMTALAQALLLYRLRLGGVAWGDVNLFNSVADRVRLYGQHHEAGWYWDFPSKEIARAWAKALGIHIVNDDPPAMPTERDTFNLDAIQIPVNPNTR